MDSAVQKGGGKARPKKKSSQYVTSVDLAHGREGRGGGCGPSASKKGKMIISFERHTPIRKGREGRDIKLLK